LPQISMQYAVTRVKAMGHKMLGQAAMERLAGAEDLDEAIRLLSDSGIPAESRREAEEAAEALVKDACAAIRELTPLPQITDCFLYKYDGLNLKSLLKARSLGRTDVALSSCGTVDADVMRHAVAEASYRTLPDFLRTAAEEMDKANAESFDPLKTDACIDKAVYARINANLQGRKNEDVREYFQADADLTNLMMVLRAHAIGWTGEDCRDMLVPGGTLDEKTLMACCDDPVACKKAVKGKKWAKAVPSLLKDTISLPLLEKEADDYKMRLLKEHRHDVTGILPLIGYLIARERESMAIRLILTAKSARVPKETLMERLREAYVR